MPVATAPPKEDKGSVDLQPPDDSSPPHQPPDLRPVAFADGEPGDECNSCRQFWEKRGEPPRKLIEIEGAFCDYGTKVVVCPWCDGTPILTNNGVEGF